MLNLKKHTIEEVPIMYETLLLLVKLRDQPDCYLWTTGVLTEEGWIIDHERPTFYSVIEWYELPPIENENETTIYHQITIDEVNK